VVPYFLLFFFIACSGCEPVSSVSRVSGYGMDDRAIEVRSPGEAKDFSYNLCVQTSSGAHPASCTVGTGGPFPGLKRGRGATLTSHPRLVPRARMSRSYTYSPPTPSVACSGTALAFVLYWVGCCVYDVVCTGCPMLFCVVCSVSEVLSSFVFEITRREKMLGQWQFYLSVVAHINVTAR
jgi:hypothetical protein